MTTESRYLTVKQVAHELQLDESTVYKKCDSGEFPSIKMGKAVRIPRLALERHLHALEGPKPLSEDERESAQFDSQAVLAQFEQETRRTPAEWVDAWRRGEIEDTAENSRVAIWALALRDAADASAPEPAVAMSAFTSNA
jgi:excisionase family DNA binding protein